jgi:CRP-like cAMP-binding protein
LALIGHAAVGRAEISVFALSVTGATARNGRVRAMTGDASVSRAEVTVIATLTAGATIDRIGLQIHTNPIASGQAGTADARAVPRLIGNFLRRADGAPTLADGASARLAGQLLGASAIGAVLIRTAIGRRLADLVHLLAAGSAQRPLTGQRGGNASADGTQKSPAAHVLGNRARQCIESIRVHDGLPLEIGTHVGWIDTILSSFWKRCASR